MLVSAALMGVQVADRTGGWLTGLLQAEIDSSGIDKEERQTGMPMVVVVIVVICAVLTFECC